MTDAAVIAFAWQAGHDWAIQQFAEAADDVGRVAPTPQRSYEQRVADRMAQMENLDVSAFLGLARRRDDTTRERVYAIAARYKPIDSWADMWPTLDEGTKARLREDWRDDDTGGWKPGVPDEISGQASQTWRWAE